MVRRAELTVTVAALLLGSHALTDEHTATKTVTEPIVPRHSSSAMQGTLVW